MNEYLSKKRLSDLEDFYQVDEEYGVPEEILEISRWKDIEKRIPEE